MAKIEDIAKKAGVSITTVSRAINNHPYVSEKTKARIFKTMEELNYTPNSIAQQLRGQKTNLIGVIISRVTNPFFAYLVNAIEKVATENGYQIVILQTKEDSNLERKFLNMLNTKQIDGLIMTNTESNYKELKKYLDTNQLVVCNRYIHDDEMPVIRIDEKKATFEAVDYLIKKGYKRIGYLTGDRIYNHDFRFQGYKEALEKNNISVDMDLIFLNVLSTQQGLDWIENFHNLKKKPDAIFTNSDELGISIIAYARERGIKIPEELAVVGFDDQLMSAFISPSLTTIHQPIEEMGRYAAELLFSKLLNQKPPKKIELKTHLVIREST